MRVPRTLHRELVSAAERDGVSLNQFINTVLALAVGRATPTRRPGRPAPADLIDPLMRRLEKLAHQLELAVAGQPALLDTRSGQGYGYPLQQAASLMVHEDNPTYEANVAPPDVTPEDAAQPGEETPGDTP